MRLALERDIEVVGEAEDGEDAIAKARETLPDVVVMDVVLPRLDGIAATARLQELQPETAVVVLSLHDDGASRERASAAGAVAFVAKHEPDDALLAAIRAAGQ
jgi:two-component system response regulator NreC